MQLSGAKILIAELKRNGVTTIFGYPGGSILSVYDGLYGDNEIEHVLTVDERGAVFMADGYARSSGKIGVCMATSGPGATNLVTGIAAAFMDSVPMVIITGNVNLDTLGHDGFQEVDTTGITMPITKYNFIVKDVDLLARSVSEAFYLASHGRKGPVLIDIPANVFDEVSEYIPESFEFNETSRPFDDNLSNAVKIINESERPMIYVGGGVVGSNTSDYAVQLAEKLNAPIGVSMMGIGAIPSNFKNYVGVGTSINRFAKDVLRKCDVFITLGARFSNKATEKSFYNKNTKLVHLDIDRAEINKILSASASVAGDLSDTLPALIASVNQKDDKWLSDVMAEKPKPYHLTVSNRYIKCLNKHFGGKQIVTTDVGQHQLWAANYYGFDAPRRFLSSCGLGAMGFGIGAAIGAHYATGENVLLITGDGSFNMSFNELLTAAENKIPLTVAIMNNKTLGMIRETQSNNYSKRFVDSEQTKCVDYVKLAEAYGANAYVAKTPAELEKILDNLDAKALNIIDCHVNKNEKSL